jgi:hypothetical protein
MQYRKFGKLGLEISALGFGAMRLPTIDDNSANIDEPAAIKMIRTAIDSGINYVDTAWPYHQKQSEILVGKALQDGYRSKVNLATKLPIWEIEKAEDLDYYLNKQLEKLQVESIDFYLLHALNEERWQKIIDLDIISWAEAAKQAGKIKYLGFSFHDSYPVFEKIITGYDWDFCQIQYNYLDTEYQAGRKGLLKAAELNIPVVVMEPIRGGWLAQDFPEPAQEILSNSDKDLTPVEWALHWLWSQPEVGIVLSGMSNLDQVTENIKTAAESKTNYLSEAEYRLMEQVAEEMRGPVTCTRCEYCLPCPSGVNIPENFYLYNQAHLLNNETEMADKYEKIDKSARADNCVECGQCESACPQNLSIIELLKEVDNYFSKLVS